MSAPSTMSEQSFPRRATHELLTACRQSLGEAIVATSAGQRYVHAHLAALRAAAAVVATRRAQGACASKTQQRQLGRTPTVWQLLAVFAPEHREWAEFFAQGARIRAACEAGMRAASDREADDLLRDADRFLGVVERSLGLVTAFR